METLKSPYIRSLLKEGRLIKTDYMIALFRKNNLGRPRFAFIISRKFSKKAVDRNRTKRIIKEALRLYGETLKNMGYDIALIPKKNILGKKTQDLYRDIKLIEKKLEEDAEKIAD
ncbi:ribonuclease P protein component [Persephonella hydrogeniphila]|uniref:Ribonuclease P protein component n=1 Tax=Persephonella hydrogeniphila TaxID=198703 RepID=A0A285NAY6_9AQUI|nr:ribonuclease P protein component [Persephonella hydrogeniphila]SNZ06654.1 ribonuclease P protein component [Persephonella hydrogeniphila]